MASALFTDPGIASAASTLSRAIAADDPYKDLANLGSASANIELGLQRRQQTEGDLAASNFLADPANAHFFDTAEGRTRMASFMMRGDPARLAQFGNLNRALAIPEYGPTDPRSAAFFQGAGGDYRATGMGAREHETADTARNATTAGAHVAAALGSARITAAQREAEYLRDPRKAGDIIPPAERKRWGIPDVVTPGVPVLEGSTESTTPSVTGPQGPFAFPTNPVIAGGATGFINTGNVLNADGTVRAPAVLQGQPTTSEQVRARTVEPLIAEAVANMTPEQRIAAGNEALQSPTVAAANIRTKGLVEAAKARAAAVAAKGPNNLTGMRAKLVADQLEAALAQPGLTDEQKQQLTNEADAKLNEIDKEHSLNSGTYQAALASANSRRDVATMANATRNRIADQSVAAKLKIADDVINQKGVALDAQERMSDAKYAWLRERQEATTQAAIDAADQRHLAKMEEIAAAAAGRASNTTPKPLDTRQDASLKQLLAEQLLPAIGQNVPAGKDVASPFLIGKMNADQRAAHEQLYNRASELLSSNTVKSVAEAVARAKQDLGFATSDVPGSIYGSTKSFKLNAPPAAAPAPTTAPTTTGAPVKRMRNPATGKTVIWNGTAWVPE
jgi:hypothetical protein